MRFATRKDYRRRKAVIKVEKRNKFLQAMVRFYQDFYYFDIYQNVFLSFSKSFLNKTKNRCQYTFSKHSIIRFYHLGRHMFRISASFSTFYGLQKSCW